MSCGNCDGRCCAVFTFPSSPIQLHGRAKQHREQGWNDLADDDEFIAGMLIPLSPQEAVERMERFGITNNADLDPEEWASKQSGKSYTCKNWNETTRKCMVYEARPQMCRDYPYKNECEHGCGYSLPKTALDDYIERTTSK